MPEFTFQFPISEFQEKNNLANAANVACCIGDSSVVSGPLDETTAFLAVDGHKDRILAVKDAIWATQAESDSIERL